MYLFHPQASVINEKCRVIPEIFGSNLLTYPSIYHQRRSTAAEAVDAAR